MPRRTPGPTAAELETEMNDWNAHKPVGTVVDYRSYPSADAKRTKTTGEAFVLSGHTVCVMLEGVSGCVALDACAPVQ